MYTLTPLDDLDVIFDGRPIRTLSRKVKKLRNERFHLYKGLPHDDMGATSCELE